MADAIQAKYQKLLSAYQEMKQKNSILKKAVIESQEQAAEREKRVEGLEEVVRQQSGHAAAIKEKDQQLRAAIQELDGIRFRNQQLSRRVEVLQDGTDAKPSRGSKKKAVKAQSETMQMQQEELMRHIQENEQLHRTLAGERKAHQQALQDLQRRMAEQTTAAGGHAQDLASVRAEVAGEMDKLRAQKESLESELTELTLKLAEAEQRVSEMQVAAEMSAVEAEASLSKARAEVDHKVKFDDTARTEFCIYNVPMPDAGSSERLKTLRAQAGTHVGQFAATLGTWLTYLEERSKAAAGVHGLGDSAVGPYISALREHATFTKGLDRVFGLYLDGAAPSLQSFSGSLKSLAGFIGRLVPLHETLSAAESGTAGCTPMLRTTNGNLHKSMVQLAAVLGHLARSVSDLAGGGVGSYADAMTDVSGQLEQLHAVFRALSSQFSSKTSLEHRLHAEGGDAAALKSTDGLMLSSLSKLVVCVEKLSALVSDNLDVLTGASLATRGVFVSPLDASSSKSDIVQGLATRAVGYMAKLRRAAPPPSVPYADALQRKGGAPTASAAPGSASAQQVTELKERLVALSQEKEQALLDCQLLTIQLKKAQAASSTSVASSHATSASSLQSAQSAPAAATTAMETPATEMESGTTIASGEERQREDLIRQHYESRMNQLTSQIQFADSKAVAYYDECVALAAKLQLAKAAVQEQAASTNQASVLLPQLKEELATTKRNYEEQLTVMTEHVMSLNNQLQQRDEEIGSLRASPKKKGLWGK